MIFISRDSNCTMKKSTIEKNRGTGIIHALGNSNFKVIECSLTRNNAKDHIMVAEEDSRIGLVGAIFRRNSIKPARTAYDSVRCSLLHITRQSQLNVENSSVYLNSAEGPCAGIFIEENSIFYSENSQFLRNRAYYFGSTYCSKSSIEWRGSTFEYNQARIGGVLTSLGCSISIEDCRMAYNTAEHRGGCLSSTNDTLQESYYDKFGQAKSILRMVNNSQKHNSKSK